MLFRHTLLRIPPSPWLQNPTGA